MKQRDDYAQSASATSPKSSKFSTFLRKHKLKKQVKNADAILPDISNKDDAGLRV